MATNGGTPGEAGGEGGETHQTDQPEELGVAYLRSDEVKKACEEFAQAMRIIGFGRGSRKGRGHGSELSTSRSSGLM